MTQHYAMLQRNLLYTGVTRGKQLVVLVGQKKAVAIAVRNVSGDGVGRSSGMVTSWSASLWPIGMAVEPRWQCILCRIRRCGSGYGMNSFDLRLGVVEILLQVGGVAEAAYDSPAAAGSCGINTRPNKPVGINTAVDE
jgi:hypothetical protein